MSAYIHVDVCGDAAVRDWLLKLKATQSMTSPSVVDHPVVESKTYDFY